MTDMEVCRDIICVCSVMYTCSYCVTNVAAITKGRRLTWHRVLKHTEMTRAFSTDWNINHFLELHKIAHLTTTVALKRAVICGSSGVLTCSKE